MFCIVESLKFIVENIYFFEGLAGCVRERKSYQNYIKNDTKIHVSFRSVFGSIFRCILDCFGIYFWTFGKQKAVKRLAKTNAKIGIEKDRNFDPGEWKGVPGGPRTKEGASLGTPQDPLPPNRYSRILWLNLIKLILIELKVELILIKSKVEVGVR